MNRTNSWSVLLAAMLSGGLMFFFIHGYEILDPGFINWIQGDADAHFLGWHFFRSEPWSFPIGVIKSFHFPHGTSVVYSDSIPLLAIPLKAVSGFLPATFQYHGLWLLLCFLLQGYFAALLLGSLTTNPVLILLGTAFFLFNPIPLENAAGQSALSSQWLIVASLYLYFREDSRGTRGRWIALLVAGTMVHFYLLLEILVICFAYSLKVVLQDRGKLKPALAFQACALAAILLAMWITGYFIIDPRNATDIGFTYHSMNLVQPINPAPLESLFLRPWPLATEGQKFSYLGLGLLLLTAIAIYELARKSIVARRDLVLPLVLAGSGLFVLSLSSKVTFADHVVFEIPLPFLLEKALGIVRASHRMFFPVPYLLMIGALVVVIRSNRPRTAGLVIAACACIQFADLFPYYRTIDLDGSTWESPLKSPSWNSILQKVDNIVMVPALPHKRMAEHEPFNPANDHTPFAFLAAFNGKTINVGQVARYDYKARSDYKNKLLEAYIRGELDTHSLYVIGEKEYLANTVLLRADAGNSSWMWGVLDGYAIIAPRIDSVELEPWPQVETP